jgi:peroxiredoxin (alkyl hydroperoxide reductase subunit C)
MTKMKDGCVKPVKGPITAAPVDEATTSPSTAEAPAMQARVGQEAPDFEATAFLPGKGFEPVKLSDHKGKWIVVCFYPGDFTFV